jgi:autotransporter translocation and assembly factor TamB
MRIVRRLTHVLVLVLTLVIGAAAAAIIVSQTAWFKNWLRGYIVAQANNYLNGTLSIERLGGNLFFGLEMENIGVSMDGEQVVAVKDLGLDYDVFQMLAQGLSVDSIRLDKPVIYLKRDGDTWSLSRLIKKQETEADREGPARPISIDAIELNDGAIMLDEPVGTSGIAVPKRFEHLDAKLSFNYEPVRYSIEITQLSFRGAEPALALNALSGGVAVKDDTLFIEKLALETAESSLLVDGAVRHYLSKPQLNLQITSDKLSLPEIAQIVPALAGVKLQPAFEIALNGPMDRLEVAMNVRSSAGQLTGKVVTDLLTPGQSVAGHLSVRRLDLAPILNDPKQKSDLTANLRVDVHGEALSNVDTVRGTLSVDAPRLVAAGYMAGPVHAKARIEGRKVALDGNAAAYGARATVAGRVTLSDMRPDARRRSIAFALSGQLRGIDLRKLPRNLNVPPAATDINADYRASGSVPAGGAGTPAPTSLSADLTFQPTTIGGATIEAGSTAGATIDGKAIAYRADATVANLNLQQIGRDFQIAALDTDRYQSDINGHVVASGTGTTPKEMDVTARGSLKDSTILGGTIAALEFDGGLADDTARVKANGTFSGFDPAVASGRKDLKGTVGGTLDVDATVAQVSSGVTPDSVQADAKVNLQDSTIGEMAITRASLDGTYHESAGDIRTLDIVGRDVNVQASGTLALNESGQSNLKVHADSPSLAEVGKLFNQPISGIGKIDAIVTGNRRELRATGNLTGNGLEYGENGALVVSSDYTARIPNLTVADASIEASTHATFVTLAGQNINELDARTTYAQKHVEFELNARQPQRSLTGGGVLEVHPDHQELHLRSLGLTAQGQSWQMAPGSSAAIKFGSDSIAVGDLALVNADQRITADGSFGKQADALKVTLENVDVANVDALLLRPPQFTGRANATATITGTKEAPKVSAEFAINRGGFKQYRYDSFGGTLNYGGAGITVDSRLQQDPTTYLTAKGYLPVALFSSAAAADRDAGHGAEVAKEDQIDFHIESTPIDLGLVQGFTTALTDVTGSMQAKIDITGSAADPHPSGVVSVDQAAFTAAPTGVSYTNLQGKIDLQPDKVHIEHISVLDNRQSSLSITGDLGLHERQVGGVQLYITAEDFKVIDNEMGNVRINSNVEIGGELRAPAIAGDLAVSTGRVNLDSILALVGESAYPTEETNYLETGAPAENAAAAPAENAAAAPAPSIFDRLTLDVRVTVPDDLVVRAGELRTPGSPISLGAINLTLGGDLQATKPTGQPPALLGAIRTIRGNYDFQGRRFEILRDGSVRFDNNPLSDMDPRLDIRTRRVIQGVEARVDVRGTLKQPEIVLTSNPPLEQADILSLIVFNQPINSLGEGQQVSLAQRAQQLATGAVAGQLANSIGNAIGVDLFEISTAPEGGSAASVTVGQQIGQRLYLKVQQGIGAQTQTNFILEYELTSWLRLQTNFVQGTATQPSLFQRMQGSGIDLLTFFSY